MTMPDPNARPTRAEVGAQLERMLDSAVFRTAPILSRLLRHVVEHGLEEGAAPLKEYALGVDVFGRGAGFDPRVDTIVRTHARRLRAKIDEYYAGPGARDPVAIDVPKGHYQPRFTCRATNLGAGTGAGTFVERRRRSEPLVRLPAPRSSMVGRDAELAELLALLACDDVRLVTVTGAGGCGKSRLSLQAAWDSASRFPGGVRFVALAAAGDAEAMARFVAAALGIHPVGTRGLESAIVEALQREVTAPLLVLLDNLEQIAGAAPMIGRWLDACVHLRVLATSRVALRLYGEHEFPLSPLDVPSFDPLPSLDELARNPAVALFVQRALATSRSAALTAENARAVAELCCRLDGLPLAIELVAAQAGNLSPQGMLARFSGHLDLPARVVGDVPERQRTLRRTIDWSHELLDASERVMLRRLAVFVGGFDLEGAEAVGDTAGDLDGGVHAAVLGLAARHLIVPQRGGDETRYTMLATLREYALERLAASAENVRVRRAHAAYCLVLAEEGNAHLSAADRDAWLARCDLEHDNFRWALAGLLERGEHAWAMRLGVALFGYWERREHVVEADVQLRAILDRCRPETDPSLWVKLANFAGAITNIHRPGSEPWDLLERALQVSTDAGDMRGIAASLNSLGVLRQFNGDLAGARGWYSRSLALCRTIGDGREVAGALSNLAKNDLLLGDPAAARTRLEEALALFEQTGDPLLVAWCLNHLGDVAAAVDDRDRARALYLQSGDMFRSLGDGWGVARCCTDLGHLAIVEGDVALAGRRFVEALDVFVRLGHRRGVAILLEGCSQLLALRARDAEALVLAGAAQQLRDSLAVPARAAQQARLDTALRDVRRRVDPALAARYWMEGAELSLDAAIDFALEAMRPDAVITAA